MAAAAQRQMEFWYDFASTYSYLSVMRIEDLAHAAGVAVAWRPFLLGPIFRDQGWASSPFNIYPTKGRYMVRDMQRLAGARGLPFKIPDPFPAHSLLAARLGMIGQEQGWIAPFTKAVFMAQFAHGLNIAEPDVMRQLLDKLDLDGRSLIEAAGNTIVKDKLKCQTEKAKALEIFGAPTFRCCDGELFWGDDRLEQALAWQSSGK